MLITTSLIGILFVVWRKRLYIKKLVGVDGLSASLPIPATKKEFLSQLFSQMFPELMASFRKIKFIEYKDAWLVEAEKFIRRLRLLSLRMDRASNTLIHKIRRGYINNGKSKSAEVGEITIKLPAVVVPNMKAQEVNNEELWKKEEQRLIIEIAKNPKGAGLYVSLGDLYIKMGAYADAQESFEAAMELDPHNEELRKKQFWVTDKLNSQISNSTSSQSWK